MQKPKFQGDLRDSEAGIREAEVVSMRQEGIASSEGTDGAAKDTTSLRFDGAELPVHRQQS